MSDITLFATMFGALGALLVALALPLMQGRVKPNPWYGFRTARTLSNPAIWYAVNRVTGRDMLLAGAALILVAFGVFALGQTLNPATALAILLGAALLPLALALGHGLSVLYRLK